MSPRTGPTLWGHTQMRRSQWCQQGTWKEEFQGCSAQFHFSKQVSISCFLCLKAYFTITITKFINVYWLTYTITQSHKKRFKINIPHCRVYEIWGMTRGKAKFLWLLKGSANQLYIILDIIIKYDHALKSWMWNQLGHFHTDQLQRFYRVYGAV